MHRSRFLLIAIAACAAFASPVTSAIRQITAVARASWEFLGGLILARPHPPDAVPADVRPAAALKAAKSFLMRMARRERPVVTPLWRFCPST